MTEHQHTDVPGTDLPEHMIETALLERENPPTLDPVTVKPRPPRSLAKFHLTNLNNARGRDQSLPHLTAVQVVIDNGTARLATTDRFRMHTLTLEQPEDLLARLDLHDQPATFVLDGKTFATAMRSVRGNVMPHLRLPDQPLDEITHLDLYQGDTHRYTLEVTGEKFSNTDGFLSQPDQDRYAYHPIKHHDDQLDRLYQLGRYIYDNRVRVRGVPRLRGMLTVLRDGSLSVHFYDTYGRLISRSIDLDTGEFSDLTSGHVHTTTFNPEYFAQALMSAEPESQLFISQRSNPWHIRGKHQHTLVMPQGFTRDDVVEHPDNFAPYIDTRQAINNRLNDGVS